MKTYGGNVESERVMDVRQFCKLYRDITKQLRHTHSVTDEDWEKVDCEGEVPVAYFMLYVLSDKMNVVCSHTGGFYTSLDWMWLLAKAGEHLGDIPQCSKGPVCYKKIFEG